MSKEHRRRDARLGCTAYYSAGEKRKRRKERQPSCATLAFGFQEMRKGLGLERKEEEKSIANITPNRAEKAREKRVGNNGTGEVRRNEQRERKGGREQTTLRVLSMTLERKGKGR